MIVTEERRQEIQEIMQKLEQKFGFEILFAVESGSRMWGFESKDSDFDVRFIYRFPLDSYLCVEKPMQNIDKQSYPGGRDFAPWADPLDFAGWDVNKAVSLALAGNASISEWVRSPCIYREHRMREDLFAHLRLYMPHERYFMHYLGMSGADLNRIAEDGTKRPVKKALYALRCLLSAYFIESQHGLPPLRLQYLAQSYVNVVHDDMPTRTQICDAYDELLAAKLETEEASSPAVAKHLPMLMQMRDHLNRIKMEPRSDMAYDMDKHTLNQLLIKTIRA